MVIKIIEHIEFAEFTSYECPTCLENAVLSLGEKWQVCSRFRFAFSSALLNQRSRVMEHFVLSAL